MSCFFAVVSWWWEIKFLLEGRLSCDSLLTRLTLPAKSIINRTLFRGLDYRQSVMILGVMCTMFFKVVSFVAVLLSDLFFSIFEGLNLSFDQVLVQGMRDSNRSVSLYYLKTSTDNNTFIEVQEQGARKVTIKQNNSKKLYTA